MSVRAKFEVCGINYTNEEMTTVTLRPVTRNDTPENAEFWKYTPAGSIILNTINPAAANQFELGKAYYVDFTSVDE